MALGNFQILKFKVAYTPYFTLLKMSDADAGRTLTVKYDGAEIPVIHRIQGYASIVTSDCMDSKKLIPFSDLAIGDKYRAQCDIDTGEIKNIQIADVIPLIHVCAELAWNGNNITIQAVSNGSVCFTYDEDGEMEVLHSKSTDQLKPRSTPEQILVEEACKIVGEDVDDVTVEKLIKAGYRKVVTDD